MRRSRRFIRHACQVPVEVIARHDEARSHTTQDIGGGGLAFQSDTRWEVGCWLRIRIALDPPYEADAQVAWCRPRRKGFLVGVRFADEREAFKARMVEQVCRIELYRQRQNAKGRPINAQQAAREWIEQHAERFGALGR